MLKCRHRKEYLYGFMCIAVSVFLLSITTTAFCKPKDSSIQEDYIDNSYPEAPSYYFQNMKKVLLLHSYHKGMLWADSITESIEKHLNLQHTNVNLYIEYMDSKRFPSKTRWVNLLEDYHTKYSQLDLDAIIAADNNALDFILTYRQQLFTNIPIIFCGINYFDPQMLIGHDNITGVVETFDAKSTIQTALQLHPNTRKLYIVNDLTPTGIAAKKTLQQQLSQIAKTIDIVYLEDFTHNQLAQRLQLLEQDSIVLSMAWNVDSAGDVLRYQQTKKIFIDNLSTPVYGIWDFLLGNGIIGGKITSGKLQGNIASHLTLDILNGQPASSLPVITQCPTQWMFDWKKLEQFQINPSLLPAECVLINKPDSFLVKHRKTLLFSGGIACVLMMIILLLTIIVKQKKDSEKTLKRQQAKLRQAVEELAGTNEELENLIYASYHDLRGPMVNINGFLHELSSSLTDLHDMLDQQDCLPSSIAEKVETLMNGEIKKDLEIINTNTHRMNCLQDSIYELSKIDRQKLHIQHLEMNKLINEIIEGNSLLNASASKFNIQPLVNCDADYSLISKVFSELLINAIHFSDPQRINSITISSTERQGCFVYEITDKGIGIEPFEYDKIFKLFHKLNPTETSSGIGIGLTLVKRIITRHKGKITVQSEPGKGTQFSIFLPIEPNHTTTQSQDIVDFKKEIDLNDTTAWQI